MQTEIKDTPTTKWMKAHPWLVSIIAICLVFGPVALIAWNTAKTGPRPGSDLWVLKTGFIVALALGAALRGRREMRQRIDPTKRSNR